MLRGDRFHRLSQGRSNAWRAQRPDERRTGPFAALLILVMVAFGGVASTFYAKGRWWLPAVASAQGREIDRLFYSTLIITGVVFVFVHVLLAVFVWQYAASGDRQAYYWHDDRKLELTYTLIPAMGLTVMVGMSGIVWATIHKAPPANALVVDVRSEQFSWRSRYPGPDGLFGRVDPKLINHRTNPMGLDPSDPASADDIVFSELHLVVNRPVRIRLRSTDVIHAFFIPAFRVQQDAVPGMTIETWFTPTREGSYEIACAELCGIGHYTMKGAVVEESQHAFDSWLAQQNPSLKQP